MGNQAALSQGIRRFASSIAMVNPPGIFLFVGALQPLPLTRDAIFLDNGTSSRWTR